MASLMDIARAHDLRVVEDCAHAIETLWQGRHVGTIGDVGAFSFYVTKNVVTGEGGMLTTTDAAQAARVKTLGLHGMSADAWKRFSDEGFKQYEVVEPGFKYNLTDLQAAIGLHQLARVEANLARRNEIWAPLRRSLRRPAGLRAGSRGTGHPTRPSPLHAPARPRSTLDRPGCVSGRAPSAAHRHRHPLSGLALACVLPRHVWLRRGDLPNAEWISDRTISLPLSPKLSDDDVDDVISAVTSILDGARH